MDTNSRGIVLRGICKSFNGVEVLHSISMEFEYGIVHALVGENGAGKSTLMKILSGMCVPDSGVVEKDGNVLDNNSPRKAQKNGIALIHQELSYIPEMTVAENIFLGREPLKHGCIDYASMREGTRDLFSLLQININPDAIMGSLHVASQQLVEIAKAVSLDSDILIMDEPTSSLTYHEVESMFQLIRALAYQGKSVVYISHKLDEIYTICDKVTVLRDGCCVGTWPVSAIGETELIKNMIGRPLHGIYPERKPCSKEIAFEVSR